VSHEEQVIWKGGFEPGQGRDEDCSLGKGADKTLSQSKWRTQRGCRNQAVRKVGLPKRRKAGKWAARSPEGWHEKDVSNTSGGAIENVRGPPWKAKKKG
jgi:hypothetical protein